MALNAADSQKVSQFLTSKGITECPACGGTTINPSEIISITDTQNTMISGGAAQVSTLKICVECANCGYALLFNPLVVGSVLSTIQ